MRFALAYAGIPREFYDRVYSEKDTFVGNAQFFGKPLNGNAMSYNTGHIRDFVNYFAGLIERDHENSLSDTAFAVIAVNHDQASTNLLKDALFPSIYCATVNWNPTFGSKTQVKTSANALVAALREATGKVKTALTLLGDEVVARSNSTPLLLPMKNFSSATLQEQLRLLHRGLHQAENPRALISETIERIKQAHPFERINDSSKRAFVDDREVIYASPGQHRHAFARPNAGHPISCLLAGKRRLGAPYDHAFHYDCTKAGQAQLKGNFFGCHEPAAEYTGDPHLNVAPNDFVRR